MILQEQNKKKIYSDGETTEQKMLEIASEYPEDLSQDYIAQNSEYTLNNTFSSVRQNILNWYPFKENAEILEIGAGMGSLTGMLCDKAKHVTAIEMSEARAAVIRARYPKRENLTIISEDINIWRTDSRYDYVVFIGVLEYAEVFSQENNPFEQFLESAKNLLKDDGVILFAIENRFGLKYWAGASEDHLQKPYVGIEGYKVPNTPKTFSKHELEIMLRNVGMADNRFYYVLPDYKFPEIICTEDFPPSYMNLQKVSFTYSKNSVLNFDEKGIYKDLIENNVWEFFANSFLVEASKTKLPPYHIVFVSAKGEVYQRYRVNTLIDNENNVYKIPVHEKASSHIMNIYRNYECLKNRGVQMIETGLENGIVSSKIFTGMSAQEYFLDLLVQNDMLSICKLIEAFRGALLLSSEAVHGGPNIMDEIFDDEMSYDFGIVLKQGYIDMTLYNAFYQNDSLIFYDQEWCFDNVPLNFILYYALKSSYFRAQIKTIITFEDILSYLKIGEERRAYDKLEDYIWSKVLYRQTDFYGEGGYCNRYINSKTFEDINNEINLQKQIIETKEQLLSDRQNLLLDTQKILADTQQLLSEKENVIIRNSEIILQLQEVEREYTTIKSSKMWKIDQLCWKLSKKFFPDNSLRKKVVRKLVRYIKAICNIVRGFSLKRVRNFIKLCRTKGIKNGCKKLAEHSMPENVETLDVYVENKEFKEINSFDECVFLEFKQEEEPLVSIIIPVYNQFTYTYYCLKSILLHSEGIAYEVLVADDCSDDLTVDMEKIVDNVNIIRTDKNLKFLKNCNHAAKQARGKYILFLNNDTQVQPGWLEPLVRICEENEKVGMVGSKLVYADGILQEAGGIIWSDASGWNYGKNKSPLLPQFNYVKEVDYISGASIMIRKSLWGSIGGFDERYAPAYCEDSDLAFEIRKKGYKVIFQPQSVVVHFEGKSNGTDLKSGIKKYQVENMKKFRDKWKEELDNQYQTAEDVFKARERGKDKKVILFIDHYVPHFDKDAGSKTTYQYIKMFLNKGYIIKFIGDNFYQHEPYTTQLEQMGVEVLYGNWYAQHILEWVKDNQQYIDFVYLNRPHITKKYIDFLKNETTIKLIYYGHDLHFMRTKREYELTGKKELLEESQMWLEEELNIMKKADVSYFPSTIEVEEIKKIDASIHVKAITAYAFEKFRDNIMKDFSKREGILFVGGFGHTPNIDAVQWFVEDIFPIIYQELQIPFYVVGSKVPEAIEKIKQPGVIIKGFVSEEELVELYSICKIAVVPLRYGAGVKGKVVEAMYYGTPLVTTSVGGEGIDQIETCVELVDDANGFARKVIDLYGNNKRLVEMCELSQQYVKKHFSLDAVWHIIENDFK